MLLWKHAIKLLYRGIALANSMAVHIYMYSMFETIVTHKYTFKTFIASSLPVILLLLLLLLLPTILKF